MQKDEVPLKCKVFTVGTHEDKFDSETADDYMSKWTDTFKRITAYHKDLIEFSLPFELMFTVTNFSGNDSDFKNILLSY